MHLREELVLSQCWVKKIEVAISKEDPRIKVTVRTALTKDVCDSFGCRELIYAGDVPRSGVEKITLEGEQVDVEFHLQNDNLAFYAIANSLGKYVAKMEGEGPVLEFQIRMTGYAELVVDLATKVKVDPIEIKLKPAQMNMELHEVGEKKEGPCVDCSNEIPFAQFLDERTGLNHEDYSLHVSGQPCANFKGPAASDISSSNEGEKEEVGAPLAAAAVMGGTHQRGRKKNKKSDADNIVEEVKEESPDFMAELTSEPVN